MSESKPIVAILGGTGGLGTGLARRWAEAGYQIIIGSRSQDKAEEAAVDLRALMQARGAGVVQVLAMDNIAAAQTADIAALTVPFAHHASTAEFTRRGR